MGITTLNGALRSTFGRSLNQARPATYKQEVFCDGQVSKWTPNLANNEIWLDGSAFVRQGLNMGVTLQYQGVGSCQVYGMVSGREMARDIVKPDYQFLAAANAGQWDDIGNLVPGAPLATEFTYEIFRLVFSGGAGSVVLVSL